MLLLLLVIQLRFVSIYLQNIDHLQLFNPYNNQVISIKNVDLDIWRRFSGLKLSFKDIDLINDKDTFKIADRIRLTLDFNSLYKNDEEAVFDLHLYGVDIGSFSKLSKEKNISNVSYSKGKNKTLEKIVKFLNRKNITSFKIEADFKNFNIANKISNFEITNISFSNLRLNKNYIGQVGVKFKTETEVKSINGFVMREKPYDANEIINEETNLIVELYGYINHNLAKEKYKIESKGFYKLLLTYNPTIKNTTFNGNFRFVNIEVNGIKPIPAHNLEINGQYNFESKQLNLKEFGFDLEYINEKIPLKGSLEITNDGLLKLFAKSDYLFKKEIIYHFWPERAKDSRNYLESLIVETNVKNPSISLKAFREKLGNYKVDKLDLKFILENLRLHKAISNHNYIFGGEEMGVSINLNGSNFSSRVGYLENDIEIRDLEISIPFQKKERIKCDFQVAASGNSIKRIIDRYTDNLGIVSGNVKMKINSLFSIVNSRFVNMDLAALLDVNNVKAIYKNKEHQTDMKSFALKMKSNRFSGIGDVKYNDIKIRKFHLNGELVNGESLKLNSADFKVDLDQPKIQQMIDNIQSKASGTLYVSASGDKRFNVILNDVEFDNSTLSIAKQSGVAGTVDFRLDSNFNFRDIDVKLPILEAKGDIEVNNSKVDYFNLKVAKLHNSSFDIEYKAINNTYKVDGSEIHFEDIQKLLKGSDNKKDDYKKDIASDEMTLLFKANKFYLKNQPRLEDIFLELNFNGGNLKKIDGYGYGKNKEGYLRIFFDEPVFALVINNLGYVMNKTINVKSLSNGNLSIYGSTYDTALGSKISGELYLYNFKLLESYLLSTILKIYALSGFSVTNIFYMFNNGINFSNMKCLISADKNSLLFNNCQAFGNAMLLSLGAKVNLKSNTGKIEGLIIPKNFFNAPIIFLQQMLSKKGKTLLDGMEDKQNFSISWHDNEKPIIKTNPISFILPSIFSNFFSKKKTVKDEEYHDPLSTLSSDASK